MSTLFGVIGKFWRSNHNNLQMRAYAQIDRDFQKACKSGKHHRIKEMMDSELVQSDSNIAINGLLSALNGSQAEALRILLERGVDVNTRFSNKESLLHIAFRMKQRFAIPILLEAGINLDLENDQGEMIIHDVLHGSQKVSQIWFAPAIHYYEYSNEYGVLELLLNAGCKLTKDMLEEMFITLTNWYGRNHLIRDMMAILENSAIRREGTADTLEKIGFERSTMVEFEILPFLFCVRTELLKYIWSFHIKTI